MQALPNQRYSIPLSVLSLILLVSISSVAEAYHQPFRSDESITIRLKNYQGKEGANITLEEFLGDKHEVSIGEIDYSEPEASEEALVIEAPIVDAEPELTKEEKLNETMNQLHEQFGHRHGLDISSISKTQHNQAFAFIPLSHVFFEHDEFKLDETSQNLLKAAAHHLYHDTQVSRIIIRAHTSNIGSAAYNHELSDHRSQAVHDYLLELGVPAALMTTQGMGEATPTDESWNRAGRMRNRRVEIFVVKRSTNYM